MVINDKEKKDFKFIINTFTKWDEPPRARHQVATEISKLYDTVFISANKTGLPKLKIESINNNLSVIYPHFPINTKIRYRVPFINELYQLWLFSNLKKLYPDHYVINFDFTARLIYRFFTKTIFYCNDNFTAISGRINNKLIYRYHLRCERTVAEKANFCIVTSGILKNKIMKYTDKVYEIQLGGPSIKEFDIKIKYEIKNNRSEFINVGLVGYIREYNISSGLLNDLLKIENIILTLIGPVEKKLLDKLGFKDRVRTLGILVGQKLFDAINDFDVAIAPYHVDKKNEGGTPNKLLLYMALGKPVVVSNLISLKDDYFPDELFYIAPNEKEFVNMVFEALNKNSIDLINRRILFSQENTWEKRIEQLIGIYKSYYI